MEQSSFFAEVFRRRVPQILGIYVAATWMAIEIGDWMTERFALPESLTAYIFIGMLALLPTIGVIAWGHGAPGKDNWTRFQVGFMGLNVALAAFAMLSYVSPPTTVPEANVAATETVTIVDDAGNAESYEVAKSGFHQALLAFFFTNDAGDPELDWLSYAAPWAMAEDLNRSPFIAIGTPLSGQSVIERLRATGFASAVGEPLSLDLQIARSRGLSRIITGSFARLADGALEMKAQLIDVESGLPEASWSEAGSDWLDLADGLSGQIRTELLSNIKSDTIVTELTIKEHTTDNEAAARQLVQALRHRAFDNDYPAAIAAAENAIELDPTFATAHVMLSLLYRPAGDVAQALASTRQALALDYKLYSETRFAMKANEQAIMGNLPQAIRMLERWAQIHPQSAQVHELLGQNYMLVDRIDDAQKAFSTLLELDPSQAKTLLSLAATYRMQGEHERGVELIKLYLEDHREDGDALISLGQAHSQQGNFEDAREAFEEAAFVGSDSTSAQLAQVKLLLREGRVAEADAALAALRAQPLDDRKAYSISAVQYLDFINRGQIRNALNELQKQKQLVQSFLPPILQVFQVENQIAAQTAELGDIEGALEQARQLREGLQPPFDSLTLLAVLEIYSIEKDQENYLRVLTEMEQFLQRYQFPFLIPVVQMYRAKAQVWAGEFDDALALYTKVVEQIERSPIALQEPLVVEQTKVEMVHALRQAGKLEDGVALVNEVLRSNPGMAAARLELVELLAAQGFTTQALNEARFLSELWAQADVEYSKKQRFDQLLAELNSG